MLNSTKLVAQIYRDLGDPSRAISDITRASELESKNIMPLTSRALELGNRSMAPENQEAILEELSKVRDGCFSDLKEAEEQGRSELTKIMRQQLDYADIQLFRIRATVCKNQGKWDEAKEHLTNALELTKKYALTNWSEQIQQELDELNKSK